MQEQNSEKVVSLSVRATKVTANVLKSAVRAYLSAQKNKSPKVYKGKQNLPVFLLFTIAFYTFLCNTNS